MKINLPKISSSLNWSKILPWLPFSCFTLALIGIVMIMGFLYYNFYQTIAQVKVVYILRSQVSLTQINLPLYEQVSDRLTAKQTPDIDIAEIKNNPFTSLPGSTDKNDTSLEAGLELAN